MTIMGWYYVKQIQSLFIMKHISIVVPLGQSSLVNIEGSLQILSEVNALRAAQGEDPLFHRSAGR